MTANSVLTATSYTQKKEKIPTGIIILLIYIGLSVLKDLWNLRTPIILIGPFVLSKTISISYRLFSIAILLTCFYGILKKANWARKLSLAWFGFGILFVLVHFVLSFLYKSELTNFYLGSSFSSEYSIMLSILARTTFVIIVNSVICWYVDGQKNFFVRSGTTNLVVEEVKTLG